MVPREGRRQPIGLGNPPTVRRGAWIIEVPVVERSAQSHVFKVAQSPGLEPRS